MLLREHYVSFMMKKVCGTICGLLIMFLTRLATLLEPVNIKLFYQRVLQFFQIKFKVF